MKTTIALLLCLTACSSVSPLVVSGESLALLGDTFADTAVAMNANLDSKDLTVEQYRAWSAFAERFKPSYAAARDLWKLARMNNDKDLEREVTIILVRLARELAAFRPPNTAADGGT